jgi:hypothetical protein
MVEPFLTYLLEGRKSIESRFSKNAVVPYLRVAVGDLVLLKSGPVVGSFRVCSTNFVTLGAGDLPRMREEYTEQLCAYTDEFWEARADKRYATLLGVQDIRRLPAIPVSKRDMRGWVVVRPAFRSADEEQLSLL